MFKIDLHMHTNFSSDGELSPKEIIELAVKEGMDCISITDHNSILGIQEALNYSAEKSLEFIPGIEISCYDKDLSISEIHIIGLFIDYQKLQEIFSGEKISIEKAIEVIKKSKGIPILAHPLIYLNNCDKVLDKFVKCGGIGIELNYPYDKNYYFDKKLVEIRKENLKRIAKQKNLLISGGSDFHGKSRISKIGEQGIDKEELLNLKKFRLGISQFS